MAKGKHAAAAAIRRAEAAHEHIDRLTSDLVEAKARARAHEDAARRLPALEAEVARLHALIDQGTSDALLREKQLRQKDKDAAAAQMEAIAAAIRGASDRQPDTTFFSPSEWFTLDRLLGSYLGHGSTAARRTRRTRLRGSPSQVIRSLSDSELKEAGWARSGSLLRRLDEPTGASS